MTNKILGAVCCVSVNLGPFLYAWHSASNILVGLSNYILNDEEKATSLKVVTHLMEG